MEKTTVTSIIKQITYKPGWRILVRWSGDRQYLQLQNDLGVDVQTGQRATWRTGKRFLSPFMCHQEVVGVVWSLIQDAEIHEAREWFRYKGAAIYNAHLDPDALVDVARNGGNFVTREDSMMLREDD